MPPRAPPPPKDQIDKQEDVLQAVVIADSYNQRFQPLTLDSPRCLLPLCNVPLLEWTLESLALAGVKEVIVFCTTKAEMVRTAIEQSKFARPFSELRVQTIVSTSAMSVGDALRELDAHKIIKSDFILLSGDVVSNLDLTQAVEAHRERRKVSKDAILTMLVKEGGIGTHSRPVASSSMLVLSPENQLLHYEPIAAIPRKKRVHIPGRIFDTKYGQEEFQLRNDLVDCGIDVCSIDIPALFTDNFDYQSMRLDFLPGILGSTLLFKTLHVHMAGSGYAARVSDTLSYDAISRDILARRVHPMAPDGNLPGEAAGRGQERYELRRYGVYVMPSTVLSRTCTIAPNTMIGSSSRIESKAAIKSTIIGRDVTVGPHCIISDSYLWDGVVIGEGSRIESSIVGKGVQIGKDVIVGKGCLLGEGVKIGDGARLAAFTRVGRKPYRPDWMEEDEDDESEGSDSEASTSNTATQAFEVILGSNARGYIWPEEGHQSDSDSDDSDIDDPYEFPPNKALLQLGRSTSSLNLSDSSGTVSVLSRESTPPSSPALSASGSSQLVSGMATISLAVEEGDEAKFREECTATLDHAFAKGGAVDTESIDFAALQIKSARSTTNVGPGIVRDVVLGYLLAKVEGIEQKESRATVNNNAEQLFEMWGPLLCKFAESEEEKVETLQFLQSHCISTASFLAFFPIFLKALYNADVVDASVLVAWYKHLGSREDQDMEALVLSSRPLIEQAVANEDDSDDDDSEEDEDDD